MLRAQDLNLAVSDLLRKRISTTTSNPTLPMKKKQQQGTKVF